ncbi:similar to Saccharomyces cerevisiae YML096W Putative protein of unknown function with similarity to asparagine synthetases [Maudiozyma barnettii]|uniref:Asparagine synthase (glutamine-hydrolyzing) n=1 Tax=Maudiozyma barnettii TaxID=61262 RepID=A0A8H2ZGB3_9SACH|nr:putative asparagine synthase [Kazachstania barnettii]CAB4252605.1 similar to Saccharomyces cerevisiae YML096W Putative protein of unknown function with similarity to asparagine synthetases [Kazachstania barnettii]CAD1780049.1 similar to Saccharomyces cerevisiae YML096W Putative protein of unknown function with similarity to asparagine synthetases [Kazachstania barnettii]
MCGILLFNSNVRCQTTAQDVYLEYTEGDDIIKPSGKDAIDKIVPYIVARGPDFSSFRCLKDVNTCWFSSILSLRQPFTKQSIVIDGKFVLQFNGELYNNAIDQNGNDTQYIVQLLSQINVLDKLLSQQQIIDVIRELDGEFAYTISDLVNEVIYFGRDTIGKRSLSYCTDSETHDLYVASITGTTSKDFINCIGGQIYIFDIKERNFINTTCTIRNSPYNVTSMIDEDMKGLITITNELFQQLTNAVSKRITTIHPTHIENSPIAVLFSGGLDCSVIVALICEELMKIPSNSTVVELLNVGFENPRTGLQPAVTPDRKLAVSSAKILKELYPDVDIRLVEVDVPYKEYLKVRPNIIDFMYPKNTEMDLSIAIAFYFASRGHGFITKDDGTRYQYNRKGVVLFSGLGADELYGGYHKFANKTTPELVEELVRQINNIHDRNLNRDDKVIAENGVEVRYPFLDESVLKYSTSLIPINYKINKHILRNVARMKLNLGTIAEEPKRAIQFGSKSAKMTKDGNKNGTDILK